MHNFCFCIQQRVGVMSLDKLLLSMKICFSTMTFAEKKRQLIYVQNMVMCIFIQSSWCFYCLVAKLCPTLSNPMDCSPPGFSVSEISPTRILEWVTVSFCRVSSSPRDQTYLSCIACGFFTAVPGGQYPDFPLKSHRFEIG